MTDDDTARANSEGFVRADQSATCARCGAHIDTSEWHPLMTETNNDGSFRVYAFCSEECRDEWAEADSDLPD